jgi:hypothetical protein
MLLFVFWNTGYKFISTQCIEVAIKQSDRVGFGSNRIRLDQFDFLNKLIDLDHVRLGQFVFQINFNWIADYLISSWVGSV